MNTLMQIYPYRTRSGWSFDDEEKGLKGEPFVAGIPKIIDQFVPKDQKTCTITFSGQEFPGAQGHLERAGDSGSVHGGTDYMLAIGGRQMVGWLCPALFKYFDEAPEELWFQIVVQDK